MRDVLDAGVAIDLFFLPLRPENVRIVVDASEHERVQLVYGES